MTRKCTISRFATLGSECALRAANETYFNFESTSSLAKCAMHSVLQRPYQIVENSPFSGREDEVGWHSGNYTVAQFLRNVVYNHLG